MKRRAHASPWRPSAVVSCLAVAACAITPAPPPAPAPAPTALDLARLAQRGHGRDAAFELCAGHACPQRTPKTLQPSAGSAPLSAMPAPSSASDATTKPPRGSETGVAQAMPASGELAAPRPLQTPTPDSPVVEQLSVHFPFASARLDAAARAALRDAAPRLRLAQEISLSGRTDSTGPAAANEWLAEARAQAVLRELLALAPGVAPRVRVEAQGACCFIESNDNPAGRARNRRVEIRYRFDIDDPP